MEAPWQGAGKPKNNNRPKPCGLGLLAEKGPQVTFELCFTGFTVLSRFRQSLFFLISRLLPWSRSGLSDVVQLTCASKRPRTSLSDFHRLPAPNWENFDFQRISSGPPSTVFHLLLCTSQSEGWLDCQVWSVNLR